MKLSEVAKAVIAAASALGTAYAVAISDGHFTSSEVVGLVVGTVIAFFGVWGTTNEITPAQVLKQFTPDQIMKLKATVQ